MIWGYKFISYSKQVDMQMMLPPLLENTQYLPQLWRNEPQVRIIRQEFINKQTTLFISGRPVGQIINDSRAGARTYNFKAFYQNVYCQVDPQEVFLNSGNHFMWHSLRKGCDLHRREYTQESPYKRKLGNSGSSDVFGQGPSENLRLCVFFLIPQEPHLAN